jgi:hypothetical protein
MISHDGIPPAVCGPSLLPGPPVNGRAAGHDLAGRVRAAAAASEFLRAVASVRRDGGVALALGGEKVRPLLPEEVIKLESLGNCAADWSRVRVVSGFDWRTVRHCNFHGDVVLGRFTGTVEAASGLPLPAGLWHSTVADCVIGHGASVRDVKLLANYVVGEGAVLFDCGAVTCDAQTAFGNGTVLSLGVESGGRDVPAYAEIDIETAAAAARARGRQGALPEYRAAVAEYVERATSNRGIVERGASVRHTPQVHNVYLGPSCRIEAATRVADSTLLGSAAPAAEVEAGACVTRALLQWGSRVERLALVDRSVLAENAHAAGHAKVTASLLGPDSGVAGGEVTASLVGPLVHCHHQALLIAAFWPGGKGNVSYGANVGSNHTGKAPDQEFWPGEGLFLGLGVNVKYPADFTRAPYTIVACGVTLLPQKLAFPFSLVKTPAQPWPGVPPAFNELIPAWVLTDNLFALRRSEGKYRERSRALRARPDCRVFRPDVIELVRDACRRLESVRQVREVYTEADIDGLGKNYLREEHRRRAAEGYRFCTAWYALLALKDRVRAALDEGEEGALERLLTAPGEGAWEHARRILHDDLGLDEPAAALGRLPDLLTRAARAVEASKAKDDERGRRIIDDYAAVHVPAPLDACVQATWEETHRLQGEVEVLLAALEERRPRRGGVS